MIQELFGKSSKNKIKTWKGEVVSLTDGTAKIIVSHGYLGAKIQVEEKIISSGKNIGKSNETSPFEQACSDLNAVANKKRDSGYSETISSIPSKDGGLFLPMLAHKWDEHSRKIKFPCYVQPKLDGLRSPSKRFEEETLMWSRAGKKFVLLEELTKDIAEQLDFGESLDGEIYVYGWSLERIISATKKRSSDTPLIRYYVYDAPGPKSFEERFVKRFNVVTNKEAPFEPNYLNEKKTIVIVPTIEVKNKEEIFALEEIAVSLGYEGLMVRNADSPYTYKDRSYDLLKLKRFEDDEFKIIGAKEATGRDAGTAVFLCQFIDDKTGKEKTFDARPVGTLERRAEYWENIDKYIGKMLTVKYQGFTDLGIPRFPVGKGVRETWDR
jgi:DNA ligase 1